jgi:hypothetical protein
MTILIDGADALRLLENAVEARGADYVYPRDADSIIKVCVYTRNGEPSCGVGYALYEAGLSIEGLERLDDADQERDDEEGFFTTGISEEAIRSILRNDLDTIITDEAQEVFARFQVAQDSGENWGFSLECAKRVVVTAG